MDTRPRFLSTSIQIVTFLIAGALISCCFFVLHEVSRGVPVSPNGFLVPILFGVVSGSVIGCMFCVQRSTANKLRYTRDRIELLFGAATEVQTAQSEQEALQVIATAVHQSGWESVAAYSFHEWEAIHEAFVGLTGDEVAFLQSNRATPEERQLMYGPKRAKYRISRSYFVPVVEIEGLDENVPVLPGHRKVKPSDNWNPLDIAYVPLYGRDGDIVGVIALDNPVNGQRPTIDTFRYLELFADLAARSIELHRAVAERDESIEALREKDNLVKEAQRVTHVGNWSHDLLTDQKYWSDEIYRILGLKKQVPTPKLALSVIHPEAREPFLQALDRFVHKEDQLDIEARIIRSDGEIRHILDRGEVIRDESGQPILLVGMIYDITERVRSTQALRESEERFRAISETAEDAIFIKNRHFIYTQINPTMAELFGRSAESLIGCTDEGLFDTKDVKRIREQDERVLNGQVINEENTKVTNGILQTFHVVKVPLYDENGQVIGICGIARDISERKATENKLQESEEQLRNIIENSTNLFYSHTADHVLTYLSPQTRNLFDCEPEEALIRWTELATDHPINEIGFNITQKAIDTGQRQPPYELELVGLKGRKVWVEVNEAPVVVDGQTVAMVGALTDITRRKEATHALEENELKYRTLFEQSPVGVVILDPETRKPIDFNHRAAAQLGYTSEEFAQTTIGDWEVSEDSERTKEHIKVILKQGFDTFETKHRTKKGRIMDVLIAIRVIELSGRRVFHVIMQDITEQKQVEAELRDRAETERFLLRELDHRVRNNLVSLSTLIQMTARTSKDVEQFADSVRFRVQSMATVHSLLSQGRWKPIRLEKLLHRVIGSGHNGEVILQGPDIEIPADCVQAMAMVISELTSNSTKYGSLSATNPNAGQLLVEWNFHTDSTSVVNTITHLTLAWKESGGLPVQQPESLGMGLELITNLIKSELRGCAELNFPTSGVYHTFEINLDQPTESLPDRNLGNHNVMKSV